MSIENVKKFYEAVLKDETLKQKFVELSQKYQGQPMDEAKMNLITEEVLPMANQMGYPFSMDDLKAYGEEMQHANMNCELSAGELEAVTGGGEWLNFCAVAGVDAETGKFRLAVCFFVGLESAG